MQERNHTEYMSEYRKLWIVLWFFSADAFEFLYSLYTLLFPTILVHHTHTHTHTHTYIVEPEPDTSDTTCIREISNEGQESEACYLSHRKCLLTYN